jgi:hypothetical protein
LAASEGTIRSKQHATTGSGDLFRARLDQIINMKHELVQLAGKLDWAWFDGKIAPLYSDQGRPGIATRFVIGLLLLKHISGPSDEGVCERWRPTQLHCYRQRLKSRTSELCTNAPENGRKPTFDNPRTMSVRRFTNRAADIKCKIKPAM